MVLNTINRKSVRTALRSLDDLFTLGRHPLSQMEIVSIRINRHDQPTSPNKLGLILRQILLEAIEELRPSTGEPDITQKAWRNWHIMHMEYINGFNHEYVAVQLGDLPRRTYMHNKGLSLDRLASILIQWESEVTQPLIPVPPTPQPTHQPQMKLVKDMVRSERWNGVRGIVRPDALSVALVTDFDDAPKVSCDVTLNDFAVEWSVIIHGQASLTTLGDDKKWYWVGFYPAEKRVRVQTFEKPNQWQEIRTFYIDKVFDKRPNRIKIGRYNGKIQIAINDEVENPNSERFITFSDHLFNGDPIPLHIGLGISVRANMAGTIIAKQIAVFEQSK